MNDDMDTERELALRIGRGVLGWSGNETPKMLRAYASDLEADQWPVAADLIRAIADAMEEP